MIPLKSLQNKPLELSVLLGVFAALTFLYALPLSTHPSSRALDLGPDTRLFLWTLGWDVHAFMHRPLSIFDANIFFPEPDTLAYSEHQIGSALLAAPIVIATGDLLLAMNAVLLLSCALSGLGAYILARELGLGRWGAVTAGIVFALTPPRFFRLGQLHLATVQWMPFCLAFVHRYARGGTTRHVLGAAALFTLQAWSGGQSGLFLALAVSGLLVYLLALGSLRPHTPPLKDLALAAFVTLALNVPFVLPYLHVQSELGLERSLPEAEYWSPNAESFVASPTHVHRLGLRALGIEDRVERGAKAYLFPGILPLVLAGIVFVRRRETKRASPFLDVVILVLVLAAAIIEAAGGVRIGAFSASGGGRALLLALALLGVRLAVYRREAPFAFRSRWKAWANVRTGIPAGFYLWLGAFSLWASLGPGAGLYTVLYRWLPGFDFIRVPSRLTLLSVLALAVLAGFGLEYAMRRRRVFGPVVLVLVLVELAAFPLDTSEYAVTTSPMDAWLADSDPGAVAVFPIPEPSDDVAAARSHSSYMLYSLSHFRPLVNGYSGFTPQSHERLFRLLGAFPDETGIAELKVLGVRYAVFHREGYDPARWKTVIERADELMSLVASFEAGRVYEIVATWPDRGS